MKILKWFGLSIIFCSLMNIIVYDFYTREEFLMTQIYVLIYGFVLVGIYYYYKNKK